MNNTLPQVKYSPEISGNNKSKDDDDGKLWTTEAVIDKLELHLCSIVDPDNNKKYEKQAQKLIYKIPIYRDVPFIIARKDLTQRLVRELALYDEVRQQEVLKAAVGRIFEGIDPRYFTQSVEKLLVVGPEINDRSTASFNDLKTLWIHN
jgi:hypothetical protein